MISRQNSKNARTFAARCSREGYAHKGSISIDQAITTLIMMYLI